jgi:hypothetical protein
MFFESEKGKDCYQEEELLPVNLMKIETLHHLILTKAKASLISNFLTS